MSEPTVLTVILNYKTPDLALNAAETALVAMEGVAGEILIVDNESQDGSFEKIAAGVAARGWGADGRVRVVASGWNGGYGAGNNFGIRTGLSTGAKPDYVYLLNSDAWPEPGAIRALVEVLEARPEAGMAGSAVRSPEGELNTTAFRFPSIANEFQAYAHTGPITWLFKKHVVWMPIPEALASVGWVEGSSLMMRQAMLDEIGLFDETFFLYFEEIDLCLRAHRAGWSIWYVPESHATHIAGASTGQQGWARKPGYWYDSRLYYFSKNHGELYAAGATLAALAGHSVWMLRRLVRGKFNLDPEHFGRDLVRHALRAFAARNAMPGKVEAPGRHAMAGERQ